MCWSFFLKILLFELVYEDVYKRKVWELRYMMFMILVVRGVFLKCMNIIFMIYEKVKGKLLLDFDLKS